MFGGFNPGQYFKMKQENSKKKETRYVTTEEFIKLMIENGVEEKEAKMQAMISRTMGACTQVGEEFIQVKEK